MKSRRFLNIWPPLMTHFSQLGWLHLPLDLLLKNDPFLFYKRRPISKTESPESRWKGDAGGGESPGANSQVNI